MEKSNLKILEPSAIKFRYDSPEMADGLGSGIVRISAENMKRLGISDGEIVELSVVELHFPLGFLSIAGSPPPSEEKIRQMLDEGKGKVAYARCRSQREETQPSAFKENTVRLDSLLAQCLGLNPLGRAGLRGSI